MVRVHKRVSKFEGLQGVAPLRQAIGHTGFGGCQLARRSLVRVQQKVVEKPVGPQGGGAGGIAQRVFCGLISAACKRQQPAQFTRSSGKLRVQAQGAFQRCDSPLDLGTLCITPRGP